MLHVFELLADFHARLLLQIDQINQFLLDLGALVFRILDVPVLLQVLYPFFDLAQPLDFIGTQQTIEH